MSGWLAPFAGERGFALKRALADMRVLGLIDRARLLACEPLVSVCRDPASAAGPGGPISSG